MKQFSKIAAVAALTSLLAGPVLAADTITFATAGPFGSTTTGEIFGVEKYVQALDGLFSLDPAFRDGTTFQVFDRATMFANLAEDLEAVSTGAIQLTYSNAQTLESLAPEYKILNFPAMIKDFQHFKRAMKSEPWQAVESRLADKGAVILGWVFNGGNQYFFTRERLTSMDDLRGKRIRYPGGDAWRLSIEAFGAQGIALPYTEVVTSLQTNLIDGLITNFAGGVTAYSLRDYTPYATMVLLSAQPIAIVANADWWNGLTAEKRKAIELTFSVMDASAYFDNMRAGLVKDWAAVEGYEANYPADADAWIAKMQEAARPLLSGVDPALLEAIEAAR